MGKMWGTLDWTTNEFFPTVFIKTRAILHEEILHIWYLCSIEIGISKNVLDFFPENT